LWVSVERNAVVVLVARLDRVEGGGAAALGKRGRGQHGGRDAEPLTHAEGVATGLASGGAFEACLVDHLVDSPTRQALRVRQPQ